MKYKAHINVMPHDAILDPQGKTVQSSLQNLKFTEIQKVRIGKHMVLDIDSDSKEAAMEIAKQACEKLLANQIMEKFDIEIEG